MNIKLYKYLLLLMIPLFVCGQEPITNNNISDAVNLWLSDQDAAEQLYGEIEYWDVSAVTNMSYLFYNAVTFDQNIGSWDVSSVTNMSYMFYDSSVFNQDISGWDVSSVLDLSLIHI